MTGFIENLSKDFELHVVLPQEIMEEHSLVEKYPKIEFHEIVFSNKRIVDRLLFNLLKSRIQYLQNTYTYRIKRSSAKSLSERIKLLLLSLPFPRSKYLFRSLRNLYGFLLSNSQVKVFIEELKPDLLINTQAHWNLEHFYKKYADYHGVKSLNIVHSWDVITTKGAFLFDYTTVIVWNRVNRLEYHYFVDRLNGFQSNVKEIGPLQFDPYFVNRPQAGDLKREYGINTNQKVLLYATSVERLVPSEMKIVDMLISLVQEVDDLFLVVRLHPQRATELEENKSIKGKNYYIDSSQNKSSSTLDNASFSDDFFDNLIQQMTISDAVINVASTMTLDALCFKKPVIQIAFDAEESKYSESVKRYYQYDHFKNLVGSTKSIHMAYSFEELSELAIALSKGKLQGGSGLEWMIDQLGTSSVKLTETIKKEILA